MNRFLTHLTLAAFLSCAAFAGAHFQTVSGEWAWGFTCGVMLFAAWMS